MNTPDLQSMPTEELTSLRNRLTEALEGRSVEGDEVTQHQEDGGTGGDGQDSAGDAADESNQDGVEEAEARNSPNSVWEPRPTRVAHDHPDVKYPKELPPTYDGNVDTFLVWVQEFEDFCNLHGCFPAISNQVEVDTKSPFEEYSRARRRGVTVDDFKRAMVARWALLKASKEPKFRSILDQEGVPHRAYRAICEMYRLDSATRTSILARKMRSMTCEVGQNPCDVLFKMEDINRQLKVLKAQMGEELLLTTFLEKLPPEFEYEQRNLMMDKPLCRKRIQSVLVDRHHFLSNSASGDPTGSHALKVAVRSRVGNRKQVLKCWNCSKPGHLAHQCKAEPMGTRFGGRGHQSNQCSTSRGAGTAATVESSNMTVEVFNAEVRRTGKTKGVYLSRVNNSHEFSMTVSCGTRRPCGSGGLSIWHCDSGSSSHLTNSRSGMWNFRKSNREIRSASGHIMPCEGIGDLKVLFVCDRDDVPGAKKNVIVTLHGVLYVPTVTDNLFSLRAMDEEGHNFVGGDGHISLFGGQLKFPIRGKLYSLLGCHVTDEMKRKGVLCSIKKVDSGGNPLLEEGRQAVLAPGKTRPKEVNWNLFHASQGHASRSRLKATAKTLGVKLTGTFKQCEGCFVAKGLRAPIPKSTTCRSNEPLGRIFCDLSGKKEVVGPGGKQYAMVFRDDYSRYQWVYFLVSKTDTSKALKRFLADTRSIGSVKVIRTDGGTEYKGEFQSLCDEFNIQRELTPANSPQYNGCAERGLSMLEVTSRAARIQAKNLFRGLTLPGNMERLWPDSMN